MFKKLDGMLVRKKMITGYLIVIVLMVFSGILAIVGETILLRNLSNYSNKVQRADTASSDVQTECKYCSQKYP